MQQNPSLRVRDAIMGAHDMYVSVGYGLLSYIRVDAPSHLRAPVMHAVAILYDVVGGAERAGVPNRVDFVLRSDNRLYAHD